MKKPSLAVAMEKSRTADLASNDFCDPTETADRRRVIFTRVSPAMKKTLKILAVECETTEQALMVEAINGLFIKYGRKPT